MGSVGWWSVRAKWRVALGFAVCFCAGAGCGGSVVAGPHEVQRGGAADAGAKDTGTADAAGTNDAATAGACAAPRTLLVRYADLPMPQNAPIVVHHIFNFVASGSELYVTLVYRTSMDLAMGLFAVSTRDGTGVRLATLPYPQMGGVVLATAPTALVFNKGSPDTAASSIAIVPRSGGPVTTLTSTRGPVVALATDGVNAYFVDGDGTKSVPLAGGVARLLSSAQPAELQVVGNRLYLANAVNGDISSMSVLGGPITTLATGQAQPRGLIPCRSDLCWMEGAGTTGNSRLMRLAPSGAPVAVTRDPLFEPGVPVFDGKAFFVSTRANVTRVSWNGATCAMRAAKPPPPPKVGPDLFTLDGIAVTGNHLYLSAEGTDASGAIAWGIWSVPTGGP